MNKAKVELRDKIAELCFGHYSCSRVWEAWQVNTMSEEDFTPLEEEEEVIESFVELFIKQLEQRDKELIEAVKKSELSGLNKAIVYAILTK